MNSWIVQEGLRCKREKDNEKEHTTGVVEEVFLLLGAAVVKMVAILDG
jgi:hypothetical protein